MGDDEEARSHSEPAADPEVPALPRSLAEDPLLGPIIRNPTLAATAAGLAILVIEILGVSRYQPEVALAVVNAADITKVIPAVAIAVSPYLLPPLTLLARAWEDRIGWRSQAILARGFIPIALAWLVFLWTPVIIWCIWLVFPFWTEWLPRLRAKLRGKPLHLDPTDPKRMWIYLAMAVFMGGNLILLPVPWMPHEAVVLSPGAAPVSVYVVGESDTSVVMLGTKDGQIRRASPSAIQSRVVCHSETLWPFRSIAANISPSQTPVCP